MTDYRFYREVYKGSAISETEWPELAARAEDYLAKFKASFQVRGNEDRQAMALCAMADALAFYVAAQNGTGGAVHYVSVGSVSTSGKGVYSQLDLSPGGQEREMYRCAGMYLDIYRGV